MAEEKRPKAHVSPHKKKIVKDLVNLFKSYPIIGSLNMLDLPAPQLQVMRTKLRGKVELFMTKKRLMNIAIEEAKKDVAGLDKLQETLKGMPALLFTKENPFTLFKTIKKNKSKAPAKAGQIAPYDLIIPAGPTPFAPGPIIGEFGAMGIKTKVDAGKIAVLNDTVVCKEGEEINEKLAGLLTRLDIKPMEIGLNLIAVLENGTIFTKKVLDIDEDLFMANLNNCARWGFNLAVEMAFPTKDTSEVLIQKAFRDAKGLALSQNILADAVVGELLGKAHREMLSLKDTAKIEVVEKKVEVKKEETKKEEKLAEQPKVEVKEEAPKEEPKKEEPKPEEKKEELKVEEKPKTEEKKEVVEEKKEEPKVEEKKEAPKVEEQPKAEVKEEPKDDVDKKVAEMVKKTKDFAEGKIPSAEDLVDEAKKE